MEEVESALWASPSGLSARFNAFLKWVDLCTTAVDICRAWYFWDKHRRAHGDVCNAYMHAHGIERESWEGYDPALEKWIALSLREVESATTGPELYEAYLASPGRGQYFGGHTAGGGRARELALEKLTALSAGCTSAEELRALFESIQNSTPRYHVDSEVRRIFYKRFCDLTKGKSYEHPDMRLYH